MSRTNAEFYNTKIKGKTRETLHLVKSSDQLANQIKKINIQEFKEVENQLIDLKFNMINVRILIRWILVLWTGAFIDEQVELAVKCKTRKIVGSNTHGGNKRKGLAKLLEKIISDGKLRGVVVKTMSLLFYQLVGQKLITAIIDTSPALLNLNMTEVISKEFPNIKQLKDSYKKLGGAEVVEKFNVDSK